MANNVTGGQRNGSNGSEKKDRQERRPVQISKENNEWNKRALAIAERELLVTKMDVQTR